MRVFVGIRLEKNVIHNLNKALEPYKKISTPIRWLNPEHIHLTIKFIGEVTPEKLQEIKTALEVQPYLDKPITIRITGFGKFGRGKELSIFWAGIDPNPELEVLYNKIETRLAKINIPKETRAFKPHITVGRNKKKYNFQTIYSLLEDQEVTLISECQVSGFQFFQSELTPSGPIYTILKEIKWITY